MVSTTEMSPIAAIKSDRVNISTGLRNLNRLSERLGREAGGREVNLAKTKLEEARMWLGKALKELGYTYPRKK